ncbi:MAG: DHH family phosphoesterase [Clostridium sp.]
MKYSLIQNNEIDLSVHEQILINRGIKKEDVKHYLNTTEEDILDPMLLDNMKEGVVLLLKHIKQGSKIFIQSDSDADGICSATMLINYLFKQFPNFVNTNLDVRMHDGKEHGIILDTVLNKGYGLVIAPDASSSEYEIHKALAETGTDVLVLDHHEAEKYSEYATVINNQLSENYPNKTLCGGGVVFKFISMIDSLLKTDYAKDFMDIAALSEIADMMDLRSFETRHILTEGLGRINNPFLKALIERQEYSLGGELTPIGLAFYIAPIINATIRVGTAEEKKVMFNALLEHRAFEQIPSTKRGHKGQFETIVSQAIRNGANIRNRQKKVRDEGIDHAEKIIEEQSLYKNQIMIILVDSTLDKNLTGLIANQLMAKYQRPVLLVRDTEDGLVQGSGRGSDKSDLKDLREFLLNSGLVSYAAGHAQAFGVGIPKENISALTEFANDNLVNCDFSPCYDVDFVVEANNFKPQDIVDVGSMKCLWGKGVEESFIAIEGVKVRKNNITLMSADRNPTIKITLPNDTTLIKFGASQEEYESLISEGFVELDVVGTCAINEWQGRVTPQILVKEYEIQQKKEYYF